MRERTPVFLLSKHITVLRVEEFEHHVDVVATALETAICRVREHLKLLAG